MKVYRYVSCKWDKPNWMRSGAGRGQFVCVKRADWQDTNYLRKYLSQSLWRCPCVKNLAGDLFSKFKWGKLIMRNYYFWKTRDTLKYNHLRAVEMLDKDQKPELPLHLVIGTKENSPIKTERPPKIVVCVGFQLVQHIWEAYGTYQQRKLRCNNASDSCPKDSSSKSNIPAKNDKNCFDQF